MCQIWQEFFQNYRCYGTDMKDYGWADRKTDMVNSIYCDTFIVWYDNRNTFYQYIELSWLRLLCEIIGNHIACVLCWVQIYTIGGNSQLSIDFAKQSSYHIYHTWSPNMNKVIFEIFQPDNINYNYDVILQWVEHLDFRPLGHLRE